MLQLTDKPKKRHVIQPKLKIGQPGDKYEQEADAVADRVMSMPESNQMQMQPIKEEEDMLQPKLRMQPIEEEEEMMQPKLRMQPIEEEEELLQPKIQMLEEEEEEPIQMKSNNTESLATSAFTRQLQLSKGGGTPLPNNSNRFMSKAFGSDFSAVNIHTGQNAVQMNQQLGARAFTYGNDIYFNKGEYSPNSSGGKSLLAHELTHVVQQKEDTIQRDPVAVAGLGLAVFESGRSMLSGGSFSSTANTPSYMHTGTPATAEWAPRTAEAKIRAFHPRIGFGEQFFYFRLSYQKNGYDLRNVQVVPLKDKSSSMISSSFNIIWGGQAHSRPKNPRAEIVFNISGTWNPVGRGIASFWGQLIVKQSGLTFNVDSEQWVYDRGVRWT